MTLYSRAKVVTIVGSTAIVTWMSAACGGDEHGRGRSENESTGVSHPDAKTGASSATATGPTAACPAAPRPAIDPNAECQDWTRSTAPFALRGRLAVTYAPDSTKPESHDIGVLDLATSGAAIQRLTSTPENESEVDIAPGGTRIVYTVRPELDAFGESFQVHTIGMDGSSPVTLVPSDATFGYGGGGIWIWPGTPDDTAGKFIYARSRKGDPAQLMVFDQAASAPADRIKPLFAPSPTGLLAELLGPDSEFGDPEISYDGRFLTFKGSLATDRDEQPSIYVLNLQDRSLKRLTHCWSDHDPVFSRDGKKVYFERYYGPGQWFIDDDTVTTRPDGTQVDEDGVPIGPWRYQWGIVEVDVETLVERVIVPPDPCGKALPWLPTVSPSPTSNDYVMYTLNDLGAWGPDGKPTRPTGVAWVSDLQTLERRKVPGTDWVHFIDWTQ